MIDKLEGRNKIILFKIANKVNELVDEVNGIDEAMAKNDAEKKRINDTNKV